MADVSVELEIERLRNLIVGFGWAISKQEFLDDRIRVSLEKKRAVPAAPVGPGPG